MAALCPVVPENAKIDSEELVSEPGQNDKGGLFVLLVELEACCCTGRGLPRLNACRFRPPPTPLGWVGAVCPA